jgi:hypothetical protein
VPVRALISCVTFCIQQFLDYLTRINCTDYGTSNVWTILNVKLEYVWKYVARCRFNLLERNILRGIKYSHMSDLSFVPGTFRIRSKRTTTLQRSDDEQDWMKSGVGDTQKSADEFTFFDCGIMVCDAVWYRRSLPMFRRELSLPPSLET